MSTIVDPLEVYRKRAEKAEAEVERLRKKERDLKTALHGAIYAWLGPEETKVFWENVLKGGKDDD